MPVQKGGFQKTVCPGLKISITSIVWNLKLTVFRFCLQEEYLEALNVQEIAKKDLDGVTRQRDSTQQEVDHLKAEADKLTSIYREQDELLGSILM